MKTREKLREYERRFAAKHPERVREKARNYQRRKWKERPEEAKKYQRDYRAKVREKALIMYGGKCACCGETNLKFLTFDHINGGGLKERRMTGKQGSTFFLTLIREKRIDIQVLCFNCNCARYFYGECPHKNK